MPQPSFEPAATFYEGVIDFHDARPDYEGIAAAVNFLRSSNVMVDIGTAHRTDGSTRFPFVVKEPNDLASANRTSAGKRSVLMLREVFDGCDVSYRKATPSAKRAGLLRACTRLASMNPDSDFAEPTDFAPRPAAANIEDDADPFAHLVGMRQQKDLVRTVARAVARYGRSVLSSCHLAFTGNPGTGKTELARSLLTLCDRTGVTDGAGTFVKADAANLIGRYVGETPRLVRDKVQQAEGGILFIDEAYRLAEDGRGGNAYGIEAVNTLVEMMESRRERFVCILAGYPDEMERLFAMNAGLRERIGFHVAFPDYTEDELVAIFGAFAARTGFEVSPAAAPCVRDACRTLARARDFANARSVRRLFERSVLKRALRDDEGCTLDAADIAAALADPDIAANRAAHPLGFTA